MLHQSKPISSFFTPGQTVHLVGIGGVSMCPLAEVLQGMGLKVRGSDMMESQAVTHLREMGIPVTIGHSAQNLGDCDFVVRTAAAHNTNPEISGAITRGIPVYERAQAWGAIMQQYKNALCVSGTHGKTTTTSMCTHIFMAAETDPTVMIGGTLPLLHAGHRVGQGDTIILESCEYCNSFLSFCPTVAVILNIEEDHLDFFKDLADIQNSFTQFANLIPEDGFVVANIDDVSTRAILSQLQGSVLTFGLAEDACCTAKNITFINGMPSFDVLVHDNFYAHVALQVPGHHNILNALAAAASAYALGISGQAVANGLGAFIGAGRRFQFKGTYNGATIYDDYAHHPSELHALLSTVKTLAYKRVIVAFQPHTYTRTQALFHEFVAQLKLADVCVLAEIYAARESNESGISSQDLCKHIPDACYCATLEAVTEQLKSLAQPGDLILTVGAGDIYRAGEALLEV